MKTVRMSVWLFALALFLLLSAGTASAAVPVGGKDPGSATYLRNGTYPLQGNTSVWFKFNYFGDESDVMLWIPGAAGRGTSFVVFAPSQISKWWNQAPMGRSGDGDDHSAFFTFSSMEAGTYYLRIDNTNPYRVFYQVNLLATSVSLGVPAASDQSAGDQVTPPPNADASGAAVVDAASHTLDGGGTLWYKLAFQRNTRVTIRIPNGSASGLGMTLFASGQMADWWNEDPLAIGSATGDDSSDNLSWTGQVANEESIYVQLSNPNPWAVTFQVDASTSPD